MARAGRIIEIVLGLFFVASAASKVVDVDAFAVQISIYGVIKNADLVRLAAYGTIAIEALLGAAFIAAWRFKGGSFGAAAALTVAFSGLIFYAWRFNGLEDCGCFGKYMPMTPPQSLLKNIVLLAALGAGWYGTRSAGQVEKASGIRSSGPIAAAILCLTLVVGLGLFYNDHAGTPEGTIGPVTGTDADRPFAKFQFDYDGTRYNLGEGEYLVVLLNATCSHCIASVPGLNELAAEPEFPEMIALMIADPGLEAEQIAAFREDTGATFPTQLIGALDFMEFLDNAPPRMMYVRDGRQITGWEWEDEPPSKDEVADAINS